MGTGETLQPGMMQPAAVMSIPMRYAVLLRDLRLSVPVFDDSATFNADEFSAIFGALKGLQVRMVNFEHQLDKIELGMSKLEHRIDGMVDQLHNMNYHDLDDDNMIVNVICSPTHQHRHDEEMNAQQGLEEDHLCQTSNNINFSSPHHQCDSQILLALEPN